SESRCPVLSTVGVAEVLGVRGNGGGACAHYTRGERRRGCSQRTWGLSSSVVSLAFLRGTHSGNDLLLQAEHGSVGLFRGKPKAFRFMLQNRCHRPRKGNKTTKRCRSFAVQR
ncbi:unnamed protein product, partial [Ectocarpus sp. 8 AP-2014]